MSDNLNIRRPADATKVNVHEAWEVEYWTKRFGVTKAQLEAAVNTFTRFSDRRAPDPVAQMRLSFAGTGLRTRTTISRGPLDPH